MPGIITMGVFALVWAIGEIWLSTVYNRAHPRRDELSDEHQATAIRFTFFVLVVALVVLGFAGMIVTLFRHAPFTVPAMRCRRWACWRWPSPTPLPVA